MSVVVIKAYFDCDGCGTQFGVEMDPARKAWLPEQSIGDLADDAVRGGSTLDGGSCSIQADLHLCPKCTTIADGIAFDRDEEYEPTRKEILTAVGAL